MKDNKIISAEAVSKSFGGFSAVKEVSFFVEKGQCIGLLGPNGAGKSTIMRMIMGLSTISEGVLEIFGKPVGSLCRNSKSRIGLVPQENNFDPDITVQENLEVYGRYFSLSDSEIKERVPKLLSYMNLSDKATQPLSSLSGGMKRRLILSRSLISNPDLLILDEPTTGLDPQARALIWNRLVELKKNGCTLLLSTHYMEEAERLCDRIIIIDSGKILEDGAPGDLIRRYVGAQVFEVQKPYIFEPEELKWFYEDIGHSVIYFVPNANDFVPCLPKGTKYKQRPANLEDVFFYLTGRQLREI